jgi:hypothetical protein
MSMISLPRHERPADLIRWLVRFGARKLMDITKFRRACAGRPHPYREDQRAVPVQGTAAGWPNTAPA